jgi:oxygen-independent coproporphyrinogen-3 oxidase
MVSALLSELQIRQAEIGPQIPTIFVGGGTPTVLPDGQLACLFEALATLARTGRSTEVTVEANPATLTPTNAAILRQAGVNRLSLGAQSFDPAELTLLERIHSPSDIAASVAVARNAGFDEINLDLIFAVPGQTLTTWHATLEQALELQPDHLACYGLTYEAGTPLAARRQQGQVRPCPENLEADMMLACRELLQAAGFEHYEISNYARPGRRCLHNVRYWKNAPHVGIGPSAAGYINNTRYKNAPDVDRYLQMIREGRPPVAEQETLPPQSRAGETAMLNLRLTEGIDIEDFHSQTGFDSLVLFSSPIRQHLADDLLAIDRKTIRLTEKGMLLADMVITDFLHAADEGFCEPPA